MTTNDLRLFLRRLPDLVKISSNKVGTTLYCFKNGKYGYITTVGTDPVCVIDKTCCVSKKQILNVLNDEVSTLMKKYNVIYPFNRNKSKVAQLELNKDSILKELLTLISLSEDVLNIIPFIIGLKKIGVKWNELSIIEKSINYDKEMK